MTIAFRVEGTPGPQGSKRAFINHTTGRPVLMESSAKVKPWRAAVKAAYLEAVRCDPQDPIAGPVEFVVTYYFKRPKSHYGTGRNAQTLKADAPYYVAVKPDTDKLDRATLDALTEAGAYGDDAQVVRIHAMKIYAPHGAKPGALIALRGLT